MASKIQIDVRVSNGAEDTFADIISDLTSRIMAHPDVLGVTTKTVRKSVRKTLSV